MIPLPDRVLQAIADSTLPCFVYDIAEMAPRFRAAASLVDRYFFPVKACPETDIVRAAVAAGAGLDLCSLGDLEIASDSGCPPRLWKFTSACAEPSLLRRLSEAGAWLDADSLQQAMDWQTAGGTACGLRVAGPRSKDLYGAKFGIPAREIPGAIAQLAKAGVCVEGIHLHDQHSNLSPAEFATQLADTFSAFGGDILRGCRYLNVGGSWPMRHSVPAPAETLQRSFANLRECLAGLGFTGRLYGEPGRWVVGPCGYWAARVAAVKNHPAGPAHRVVILDTNTPVPSRPTLTPFALLRNGRLVNTPPTLTGDLFGSANTALDTIGTEVRLPDVRPGDVLVSLGQGAYTRSLIPPFNERARPMAVALSASPGTPDHSGLTP